MEHWMWAGSGVSVSLLESIPLPRGHVVAPVGTGQKAGEHIWELELQVCGVGV